MKIYNGNRIIPGLIIFLALVTFPLWYNMGKAAPPPQPKIDTIAIQRMAQKQCIMPKEEMRTGHMQLLNDWRTSVVRDGQRVYVAADGKKYEMSLQNECMKCHSNKSQFCDQCHTYAGLSTGSTPYCWTCHVAPKENK
ncbi:MAG: sulfate reduction electron transfer complex DsrMKJOP subunit DsrJ [Syntrophobacteraceae bacterium]|nr:sulfate reduction electron transfer complex DsrMKJOP subunit DsrJ [Desulfobacteraceae bacterium]